MWVTDFYRDDRGNVAVLVALTLTVVMGFVALGVDGASLYRQRAQVQSVSDLAAVSAMRDTAQASARAERAVTGNGLAATNITRVEVGRYRRNPALPPEDRFSVLADGTPGVNAVRVALTRAAPLHFARAISDDDSVSLSASALAARTGAARFTLTSHMARLEGATLNDALSRGLGVTVSLSAADSALLTGAELSLGDLLDQLGQQTGLAQRNPAAILDASVTVSDVLRAAQARVPGQVAAVLDAGRGSARAVPVSALAYGADTALGLTVTDAAARVQISALDVLRALALVNLTDHGVDADLALDVPGLLDVAGEVELGARAAASGWMALGEAGVTLHRPAARLHAQVDLAPTLLGNLGLGVTATHLALPLLVELAGATATLDKIACDAPLPESEVARFVTAQTPLHPANGTSVAALYLGVLDTQPGTGPIDPATLGFADLLTLDITVPVPLLPDLQVRGLVVQARSHTTVGASRVDTISFSRADVDAGRTTGHFGSGEALGTAIGGLLDPAHTELRVKPGQSGLVSGAVSGVLSGVLGLLPDRLLTALVAPVDAALDGLLDNAGLALGEGELTLDSRHCELIRLVQ